MSEVALYTDYKLDESYTPARVSIRVGNTFSDLREVRQPCVRRRFLGGAGTRKGLRQGLCF